MIIKVYIILVMGSKLPLFDCALRFELIHYTAFGVVQESKHTHAPECI